MRRNALRFITLVLPLLLGGAAQAQYAPTDAAQDHRWTPDTSGFQNGIPGMPSVAPGTAGTSKTVASEPPVTKPPEPTGMWAYAFDGHTEYTCTRGFGVAQATLGCYDSATQARASESTCNGTRPQYATCKYNGYGVGNCPTDVAHIGFSQTSFIPSVAYFYDWKGTCYPSTITPYR